MDNIVLLNQKTRQIADYYLYEAIAKNSQKELGALSETGGTIISKSFLHNTTKDAFLKKTIAESIQKDLNFIFQTIENSTWLMPTFCNGLAGTGWLLEYLKDMYIINIDLDEFLEDIDILLNMHLDSMIEKNNYDILHGYLGLGVYFLKRSKTIEAEKIILALHNSRVDDGKEIKWKSIDPESKLPVINFSLSHGNASILYFLGKCFSQNICVSKCLDLIRGLFKFFFNNLQNINVQLSYFPNAVGVDKYKSGEKVNQDSRLAWCYGDLGILHTMYLVSNWIGDKSINEKVLEMLLWETKRLNKSKNWVNDAGFCHGSSGIGYIFKTLYDQTGIINFKEASEYWMKETIKMGKHSDKQTHGFLFPKDDILIADVSMISGLGGVFAFLSSSQLGENECPWNECFFLS